jgi:hypothetical protein
LRAASAVTILVGKETIRALDARRFAYLQAILVGGGWPRLFVSPVLDLAAPILKEIYRSFPEGGADLETITRIVTGVTRIDRTCYTEFVVPRDNPIWGSFKRFEQSEGVYAGEATVVHVRYAAHLSEDERIFIVSKELCHSLEDVEGQHVVTDSALDDLVAAFSLLSSAKAGQIKGLDSFTLELLATIVASEMVCPLAYRRKIITAAGDDPDWDALGAQIKIPMPYRRMVCSISQMNSFEHILRQYDVI